MEGAMWVLSGFADEISADLDVQCRTLTELGLTHLEFRSAWNVNVLDLEDDQLRTVASMLRQAGLSVSSIGSPIGKVAIEADFDQHLRRFDQALRVSEILAAPYIRLFSFLIPDGTDPGKHRDEVLRRMALLADRVSGHDVTLLHENEKGIYGDSPERCLDIVESVGSPRLRLAWDAANFVQCGFQPYTDAYQKLRPYLEYVQVKDARLDTGRVVAAGLGDGEVRETVAALHSDGFDGFFSLEPHLADAGHLGGFSGPELFAVAHQAFVRVLNEQGIEYR
ncbi:sugar phosphate isomerase/epimerase family protein [Phytohabitans kaempferiae]|uniref:Sugar phosphate isomerase/epimerase family protein n=1 Tax=Phytohabitans kaempferiae TaxID=1620943 RepID=A0ABV6MHM7_9ACTN